jgi:hypothetical protein
VANEIHLASPPDRTSDWRMSPEFAEAARAVSLGLRRATEAAA